VPTTRNEMGSITCKLHQGQPSLFFFLRHQIPVCDTETVYALPFYVKKCVQIASKVCST
jgi:hypothetical protein